MVIDDICGGDLRTKQLDAAKTNWYEVRPQGRIPERRAYHSSCVGGNKIFIYGGSDI